MDIFLKNVIPDPMQGNSFAENGIWNQSVTLNAGAHYLIHAKSGEGKSSLMSFLYGLRFDYSGEMMMNNSLCNNLTLTDWIELRKQSLSAVFQTLSLFDDLTLMENIQVKNELTAYKTEAEIESMLNSVGMLDYKTKKVGILSMGQKQRVAIVRALCQPFQWILMDEPFSHLDKMNTGLALELIMAETEKQGAGMVLTSLGNEFENRNFKILNL